MSKKQTIAVIGGGASGIMAAINAAKNSENMFNVVLIERMNRIGKKILATGNGRCNYTNINASVKNYYGKNPSFVKNALKTFSSEDTIEFFNKLGIIAKEEQNGKIFPYSDQASSILDCLRNELDYLGVEIKTEFEVRTISSTKTGFSITSFDYETIHCKKLIVSAGGCASPNLGSNGTGFKFMKPLGHFSTPLNPALVQLKTDNTVVKGLQGIKFYGKASAIVNDIIMREEEGEILFTDYGISGPPIFQLSGIAANNHKLTISLDFMPNYKEHDIYTMLSERKSNLSHLSMEHYFNGMLNKRIGNVIAKKSGIEKLSMPVKNLSSENMWAMTALIKSFYINITGSNGWNNAQVTAGGIETELFCDKTMESKLFKGLYCTGEIFDIFGDCGGYNLQWAWSSGYTAGVNAAGELKRELLNDKNK